MKALKPNYIHLFSLLLIFLWSKICFGLQPDEVLVVANKEMVGSVDIAKYYMQKRGIPQSHLLSLELTSKETMPREEFDSMLKPAVIEALENLKPQHRIEAIVLVYGVPLKVAPPQPGRKEKELAEKYKKEKAKVNTISTDPSAAKKTRKDLRNKIANLLNINQRASVDSELALIKADNYPLAGWVKNPYFLVFQGIKLDIKKNQVLLVSRLDGPDKATVYRIIDDTLATEATGLNGNACFDARWPKPLTHDNLFGYRLYDASLHDAAKAAGKRMDVVIDDKEELFQPGACPQTALYSGWYSLAKYIDSFEWQRGSIGYHIASSECSTLRNKNSQVWCLKMLEKGVAATIGPVYEPYIQGFPLPAIFFTQLIDGYMSLGESYLVSLPYLSWQMVLIGDPLYQPFKK
ncbi:MAG: TIGR03790 family protein [Desulforhopalus sp.]